MRGPSVIHVPSGFSRRSIPSLPGEKKRRRREEIIFYRIHSFSGSQFSQASWIQKLNVIPKFKKKKKKGEKPVFFKSTSSATRNLVALTERPVSGLCSLPGDCWGGRGRGWGGFAGRRGRRARGEGRACSGSEERRRRWRHVNPQTSAEGCRQGKMLSSHY